MRCISINSEATESLLEIRDEGSGISQEALPHIFERFFRTDQSRSRETGGFGLGLAIVRAIVLRYQGTVRVKSAPGQGTSFKIGLPKGRVSAIDDGLHRR
jgi:signal transduction histidine kinase